MPKRRRSTPRKRVAGGSLRKRGTNTRKTPKTKPRRKRRQSRARSQLLNQAKKMRAQKHKSRIRLLDFDQKKSKT